MLAAKPPMKAGIFGDRVRCPMDSQQLGIILTGFSDHLQSLGYAPMTVQDYIRSANHFCRWLKTRSYSTADINRENIRSFLEKHLRHCHCSRPSSRDPATNKSALWQLFELLQAHGIIHQRKSNASSPKERIIGRFDSYLLDVCGVAETTRQARRRMALELLTWRFGNRPLRLQKASGMDLLRFVAFRARTLSPRSIRVLSDSLRSFLRFLQFEGHCLKDLCVPSARLCKSKNLQKSRL